MALPPGIPFLTRLTLHILARTLVPALLAHYTARRLNHPLPTYASVLVALAALPLSVVYMSLRKRRRQRAEAVAMGARMAPRVSGFGWANLGWLKLMLHIRVHGYPGDGLLDQIHELGDFLNFRVLGVDAIFTTCPEHIKHILATNFPLYEKGPKFQQEMASVLGSGVFNSDGDLWRFHRSVTRPFFSKDKITHFDIFDTHAEQLIAILRARASAGYAVDMTDLVGRFTMDSATEFLFGVCVDSLKANIPYAHDVLYPPPQSASPQAEAANLFLKAFGDSMHVVAQRDYLGDIWPLWEILEDKTRKPMEVVSAFIEPIVQAAIAKQRERERAGAKEGEEGEAQTLLEELLRSTDDPKLLKDETLNILLAGRDTTGHTLTIIIYFLSAYPTVHTRLRAEILSVVGPSRSPTYEDIKEMKYLRAVINESLRLYPPVPFNVRTCIESTTWPSPEGSADPRPVYIPAGATVPYSVFLMHRREDLWGEDAQEFDPDRFLDDRMKKYILGNAFAFLPFNAGPRICLGQQFAYNEMSFLLVRLLQAFTSFTLDEAAFRPGTLAPESWAEDGKGEGKAQKLTRKAVDRFRPRMHLTMYTEGMWVRAGEA
uniref:Cytochrome P450 n=1 Tax=Mycena chlorophos TaxID=658473 RepID=A0ABQ0LG40_MYCCL|nr:cytochrome P450 [Mycena chlorophos]